MTELPWWYSTIASVFAVGLSVWVGLHFRSPEWVAIYGAAALACAALPAHRTIGWIGLAIGLAIAGAGAYLLRGIDLVLADLTSADGGAASPVREAAVLAITALWLVIGSLYRTRRV